MAPSDFRRHETHAQPRIEESCPNGLRNTETRCRRSRRRVAAARHRGRLARDALADEVLCPRLQGLGKKAMPTWQHPSPGTAADDENRRIDRNGSLTAQFVILGDTDPGIGRENQSRLVIHTVYTIQSSYRVVAVSAFLHFAVGFRLTGSCGSVCAFGTANQPYAHQSDRVTSVKRMMLSRTNQSYRALQIMCTNYL